MHKKFSGFTLIELVVVVLIISVLAASALPAYLKSNRSALLANAVNDTLRIINDARTRSISGWAVGIDKNADKWISREEAVLPDRFGVWFNYAVDRQQVILFADLHDKDDPDNHFKFDSNDFVIEENDGESKFNNRRVYTMPEPIYLSGIIGAEPNEPESNFETYDEAYIFFDVPTGEVSLWGIKSGGAVDELQWLRADVGIWDLTDEEWRGDVFDDDIRNIVIKKVSNYAYVCSPVAEYNENDLACSYNF